MWVGVDDAYGRIGFRYLEYLWCKSQPDSRYKLYRFAQVRKKAPMIASRSLLICSVVKVGTSRHFLIVANKSVSATEGKVQKGESLLQLSRRVGGAARRLHLGSFGNTRAARNNVLHGSARPCPMKRTVAVARRSTRKSCRDQNIGSTSIRMECADGPWHCLRYIQINSLQ